jgi:uncharacterized protein YecT (DUF1311 family)
MLRYFPIAAIACIEAFFRLSIKKLIDSGEPYLSNSESILPKNNISYEVLKGLVGQSITIGDLIAYSVSISSLTQLSGCMDKLMDCDFLKEISQVHDRWAVEVEKQPKSPILAEAEATLRDVARCFELRHIYCHETATNFRTEPGENEKCYEATILFLKAADQFVSNRLFPDAPLTQADMNAKSAEKYLKSKQHLQSLIEESNSLLSESRAAKFREVNEAWEIFAQMSADFESMEHEGGTIYPTIANSVAATLTEQRSRQVEDLLRTLRKSDWILPEF